MEKQLEKEKKKAPRAIVIVPETDKEGHSVFKCLLKDDAVLVKAALNNPHGVKVKSEEGKTCPIEPNKPYNQSICKKIVDLRKAVKKSIKKEK